MTLRTREMRRSALVNVPSFSRKDAARQEDVRVARRLDQEQVLHDDAFHRGKRGSHVARVRVRLGEVLALDVERAETAVERRLEHVRDAKSWLVADRHIPGRLEVATRDGIRHVPVARQLVRERAHVAGALHVVLSAQRIHAHALAADVAGRHREVRDAHDHGRALAVLGDAEAVVNRAVAGRRRTVARPRARSCAGTPLTASVASGEWRGSRDEVLPLAYESVSQRARRSRPSRGLP